MSHDTALARDLQIFIDNDGDLYRQQTLPIQKNLSRKWQKGTYDSSKAPKIWEYLVESGAKKYHKDAHASGKWYQMFPPALRRAVAKDMAADYEEELEMGNFTENPADGGDFDEDTVLAEMADALDEDVDGLSIEDSPLESFGEGEAFTVSSGRREYTVVEDEDVARDIAIASVKQDLEHEPEMFDQDWLMGYVDQKALKKWVFDAVMEDDYADELANDDPERFWEEMEQWNLEVPEFEEDEDGDEIVPDPMTGDIDELREAIATDRSQDPMDWIRDIWGDDAAAKAMEVGGIDFDAAAEGAIDTDGWPHFLCRYDGNYDTTDSGFVWWRDN